MIFKYFHSPVGKIVKVVEESLRISGEGTAKKVLPGHVLFHFYVSPYAMRVRKAIYDLRLEIPMRDTLNDDAALEQLIREGGKDQVPCLRIETKEGVRWMYESRDIVRYLETQAKKTT